MRVTACKWYGYMHAGLCRQPVIMYYRYYLALYSYKSVQQNLNLDIMALEDDNF